MTSSTSPSSTPATLSSEAIVVQRFSALRESRDPSFYRLKRASRLLDVMLEPVFAQTTQQLTAAGYFIPHDNIACALWLQGFVEGRSELTLGAALRAGHSNVSDLRFSQLISATTPDELFTHVQRALRMVNGRANAFDVARVALNWTEHKADWQRKRLIAQFHELADVEFSAA